MALYRKQGPTWLYPSVISPKWKTLRAYYQGAEQQLHVLPEEEPDSVVKSRSNYVEILEELRTSHNQDAVDGFPVNVYVNGIYQSRYTINIPKDAWMVNMDDELDTHCILCGENYISGCFWAEATIDGSDWIDEVHNTVPDCYQDQ